jgi:FKBP-type peptidyl-prolyl cis-trans isomerase FkpA
VGHLRTATLVALASSMPLLGSCAPHPSATVPAPQGPALATEADKTLYALGVLLGKNVQDLHLGDSQIELVALGLADQAQDRPARVDMAIYAGKAQQWGNARRDQLIAASAAERRAQDRPFEEAAARESGARMLPDGAILRTLVTGRGEGPSPSDRVRISYEARLADGTVFDTTAKHSGEARLALNEALPCMKEALLQMRAAETVQLVCPAALAYGDPGRPPKVPGGATVVFKLSLLEVNPEEAPPARQRTRPEPAKPGPSR